VPLVRNDAQDADEQLADTEAGETGNEDRPPTDIGDEEPREAGADECRGVETNGQVESI
jgi:hypothetical protein